MLGLKHSVNVEGAKYNIMCNSLAPVEASRLTENILTPDMMDKLRPEFVMPLVVYLVSESNQDANMIFNARWWLVQSNGSHVRFRNHHR